MGEIPLPADETLPLEDIASDVVGLRLLFVNLFAIRSAAGWTLVDAGLYGSAPRIRQWARQHFGDEPPAGIILTHAHFDHVGALETLLEAWRVPVYVHAEEIEYAQGVRPYPPPDPSVGGGAMARMASLYPRRPVALTDTVLPLPADGSLRGLPGWRWIHTPGHTAGHVSLFREADRTLIAGDAFCTTKQESFFAALVTQKPELHGPPAYFTTDWDAAEASVTRLAELRPARIAAGHGRPMAGDDTTRALSELAARFRELAVPEQGRYVERPTRG
jgi:glyoxylase-like metal-dependent hydrolase (beta-lactamase superfamily II)